LWKPKKDNFEKGTAQELEVAAELKSLDVVFYGIVSNLLQRARITRLSEMFLSLMLHPNDARSNEKECWRK
jgi:hypothetical protein